MGFQLRISPGFVLLGALLVFFDDDRLLAALIPAVLIHEAGHALVMLCFGAVPRRLSATATGLWLDYSGELEGFGETLCALAGPALGLFAAYFCSLAGKRLGSDYLLLSAGVGAVLSLFNLLPCLPLDGGRALAGLGLGSTALRRVSIASSIMLTILGLFLALRGRGVALCLAGVWLLGFALKRHL